MARPFGSKNAVKEEETAEVSEKESSQAVFKVFDSKGDFVREYTVEASGKDAGKFAKVFADEIGGTYK